MSSTVRDEGAVILLNLLVFRVSAYQSSCNYKINDDRKHYTMEHNDDNFTKNEDSESSEDYSDLEELCRLAGIKNYKSKQTFSPKKKRNKLNQSDTGEPSQGTSSSHPLVPCDLNHTDTGVPSQGSSSLLSITPCDMNYFNTGEPLQDSSSSPPLAPYGLSHSNTGEPSQGTSSSYPLATCDLNHSDTGEPLQGTNSSTSSRVRILSDITLNAPFIRQVFHGDLEENKKRMNKALKNPKIWQRNKNKKLRLEDQQYLGYRRDRKVNNANQKFKVINDVNRSARTMKESCDSGYCRKSKLRACNIISESTRKTLFDDFWQTVTWEQRRQFVCSHVLTRVKKVTKNPDSRRKDTLTYFFTIKNQRLQICKKMFLNTLGLKEWFIRYWLDKSSNAMPPKSEVSRRVSKSPKKKDTHEYLEEFFDSLPKMPSHYCRKSTTRQYLEPIIQNMSQIYVLYKNTCDEQAKLFFFFMNTSTGECHRPSSYEGSRNPALSRRAFDNLLMKHNLSLFRPKKDQCDLCCGHTVGNISEEEWKNHTERKDRARLEKELDKASAILGLCHVFTQDVEAVKLAPYLQASAICYKTKLCVHNFTLYNLANHEAVCYWFDESNGGLEASVFASCIISSLQKVLEKALLPVILFSDGCCAQNRNTFLSNAVAIEKKVILTQKFLENGHTQMECDSVHSAIECKLKGQEIFLPSQYSMITKSARTRPMPYESHFLDYNGFTDFSKPEHLIYPSIRPGRKVSDPTVSDLRVLEYKPDGTIWYKLNYDDLSKPLPHRPKNVILCLNSLPKLYNTRLPIARRKYVHLQELKAVIPADSHSFYNNLPHCSN